jgi:hypothetical protein
MNGAKRVDKAGLLVIVMKKFSALPSVTFKHLPTQQPQCMSSSSTIALAHYSGHSTFRNWAPSTVPDPIPPLPDTQPPCRHPSLQEGRLITHRYLALTSWSGWFTSRTGNCVERIKRSQKRITVRQTCFQMLRPECNSVTLHHHEQWASALGSALKVLDG